jgi:hypothetical protein
MAQLNVPLTGKEKEKFKTLLKPQKPGRLLEPKTKYEDKNIKDFYTRQS